MAGHAARALAGPFGGSAALAAVAVAVGVVLVLALVRLGRAGGAEFVIRYRPGRPPSIRGRIPASKIGRIEEFLARDLRPLGRLTIRGDRGPGRPLRLRIAGPLDAGRRQRARNFLMDLLG